MSCLIESRAGVKPRLEVLGTNVRVGDDRPKTRAECVDGPRPCPWVSCRHHLALNVDTNSGVLHFTFPEVAEGEFHDRDHTCSLDVAGEGEHTLTEVADLFGVSRERIRQIQELALERAQRQMRRYR